MIKFIALAALLLVTGCTANDNNDNMTQKQTAPKQVRMETSMETPVRRVAPPATVTQASSTSTTNTPKSSISMNQASPDAPPDATNWLDWLLRGQMPTGRPTTEVPAGRPTTEVPTGRPTTDMPADKNPAEQTATSQFEQQVLNLVNQERTKAGLAGLSMDGKLSDMAMVKAKDMYDNNYFDHNSPSYGSPFDMMRKFGITYNYAGENIAKGQNSPTQVMNDWMNSPGHRANILKSSFTKIGVAYYKGEWVQEFIG